MKYITSKHISNKHISKKLTAPLLCMAHVRGIDCLGHKEPSHALSPNRQNPKALGRTGKSGLTTQGFPV